jgi:hypothetical protein
MGMTSQELRAEMGDEEYFQALEAKQNEKEWADR